VPSEHSSTKGVLDVLPPRVLIADDEAALRNLIRNILTDYGCATVEAVDGADAIERLKTEHVDAILLDLRMPNVDGWGVLEFVRGLEAPPRVVIVSGLDEVIPPGHLNQYVSGVITKPFAIAQLLKTLELAWSRPAVVPQAGSRNAPRRTFVAETTLLSETGQPLAIGQLQEVSEGGFRVELSLRLQAGDPVRITFKVPGRAEPVEFRGRVKWHQGAALGAEIEHISEADTELLRRLLSA
jgi:CheY-like chemotaxis protein